MSMSEIKLPPILTKVVLVFGLVGMLIGVLFAYLNQQPIGMALVFTVGLGVVFSFGAKFFIVKWMYYWMETKLEVAAKEKEEARKLEMIERAERKRKAEEESARLKAEASAMMSGQTGPVPKK